MNLLITGKDINDIVSSLEPKNFNLLDLRLQSFLKLFGKYSNVSMDSKVFQVSLQDHEA
jgi:hypothetical protein